VIRQIVDVDRSYEDALLLQDSDYYVFAGQDSSIRGTDANDDIIATAMISSTSKPATP
jgi:hypothetical protein